MIQIGKINTLQVKEALPFGFHLTSGDPNDPLVLLSHDNNQLTVKEGDEISVFVATDETGSLTAWTTPPVAQCGETVILKAVGATHFGAFFHWGLNKDLLVPSGLQEGPINEGMNYVVHIFYDENTQRVLGATKLHKFLAESSPDIQAGDNVSCMVYGKTDLGFKVVINKKYLGLIFHSDAFKKLKIGDETDGVIKTVRPDGKIDVALQRVDKAGRQSLEEAILEDLQDHGGISTLTDKSQPEEIYAHFNVSKAAYKKALGALYKKRLITIDKNTIRLI
ncbi:S1-like domain-containing RNA-binding protein [Alteromonas sp. C1M14]|uniref:CvfB family protein n=1 Tax=Alteromonas sp. C1M14 TaxID=2841567 RepID=UPI001C08D1A3|nr:S1-like domain-containing RNA-binding protein [Alteromonas sp. C1M14]MBU2976743.1 hypothetical protein [Alteromonas sp. C1M14]